MRTIHYCWFGGKLPKDIEARVARWRLLHPTWRLQEWNDPSAFVRRCPYASSAVKTHSWAYLSDYVRLHALREEGGVYLDTDVELLKPLEPLLDGTLHIGYMHNCALGTAVIIAPPRHPVIEDLMTFYERLKGSRMLNNNAVFTEYFLQSVPGFRLNGRPWRVDGLNVHPKSFFEQPSLIGRGYSVHFYNRSWGKLAMQADSSHCVKASFILAVKRMLRSWLEESRCFYMRYYLRDRYGLSLSVPELNHSFEHVSEARK